ncbi:MAG: MBL fold metallo-hydrolase [Brevefilum sp.]|nr:MBL fold metallo-hydrolase [Brevefilum sp.]MDT8381167.1 MBL fold metallo-hydrolase [Brevefilum sp.]MDW7754970.1 MBL fold metallo-hydrolase [Brevefilum sp.]
MPKVTFLGTASAIPDANHQNAHIVIKGGNRVVLVDCPGNPFVRLHQAKINPLSITDLILTHFHPDHVTGFPLLLMDLWLIKRKAPLMIYGLPGVLEKCKQMMGLYDWDEWNDFFPVTFVECPNIEGSLLFASEEIKVWASPAEHLIPSISLKASFVEGSICYSGDTAPSNAVVNLAKGCDILIHEATGNENGHSSPGDAGKIAQTAGVKRLFLIHYPFDRNPKVLLQEAKANFSGTVVVAEDLMVVEI